jgi:arsenite methyltransferase
MDSKQVKSIVRERYARASSRSESGVAPGAIGYEETELNAVPVELRSASLGCGSPVSAAGLRAGERVLDLGSGAGLDLSLAARAVGPTGHVFGVDMTPEMLAKARANVARQGLANVTLLEGDIEAIPLPDASVNVVISNCVINLAPDKGTVFREAFRVLAPGGRFVVADMLATAPLPARIAEDPEAWGACIAGAIPEGDYVRLLRAAGFAETQVTRAAGCCGEEASSECCAPSDESAAESCCDATATEDPQVVSAIVRAVKPGP